MLKRLYKQIYAFDIFGAPIALNQKRRDVYNTFLGSLFSMGIICFCSMYFIYSMIDMFSRKYPIMISQVQYTPSPEAYQLTPSNFYIGFMMLDQQGTPFKNEPNKKYFAPITQYCDQIPIDNSHEHFSTNCTDYEMNLCSENVYDETSKDVFQMNEKELKFGYCTNSAKWLKHPMKLQGQISEEYNSFARFMIRKCHDQPELDCASEEEMAKVLTGGWIIVTVADQLLNEQTPENPYRIIKKNMLTSWSVKQMKNLQIYYRHSYTKTVENFFYYFERIYNQHVLQFQEKVEDGGPENTEIKEFFHVHIFLEDRKIQYTRTYSNIYDILGSVGGLLSTLTMLLGVMIIPITKLQAGLTLANSIFAFDTIQKQQSFQILPQDKAHQLSSLFFQRMALRKQSKESQSKTKEDQSIKILKQFLLQKAKKLKLVGCEKISVLFGGPKKKQLEFGLNKIKKKLDITFIICKLIEVDKLKQLLLNKEQQKLFDYLPKPTISGSGKYEVEKTDKQINLSNEKHYELKVKEAMDAYKVCKTKDHPLDKKLIDLLDNEIKSVFDQALDNAHFSFGEPVAQEQMQDDYKSQGSAKDLIEQIINIE